MLRFYVGVWPTIPLCSQSELLWKLGVNWQKVLMAVSFSSNFNCHQSTIIRVQENNITYLLILRFYVRVRLVYSEHWAWTGKNYWKQCYSGVISVVTKVPPHFKSTHCTTYFVALGVYNSVYLVSDTVSYRPVSKRRLCKQRPLLGNARNIHAHNNRRTVFCMWPMPRYSNWKVWSLVSSGSDKRQTHPLVRQGAPQ
jgi:hypothetical protein